MWFCSIAILSPIIPLSFYPQGIKVCWAKGQNFPRDASNPILMRFFLYKYHLGKNTSVIFKISCVIVIILYSRVIKLKMEKFPNFILISYLLLWQQMERVIWLCNLFLKCEIQILCSNWNPLRFQEKLSHFQHSLSPQLIWDS